MRKEQKTLVDKSRYASGDDIRVRFRAPSQSTEVARPVHSSPPKKAAPKHSFQIEELIAKVPYVSLNLTGAKPIKALIAFFTRKAVMLTEVVAGIIILACASGYYLYHKSQIIVPLDVQQKMGRTAYLPTDSGFKVDKSTVAYNPDTEVFTYTVIFDGNSKVQVSQQPIPASFLANSAEYDQLVESMEPYLSISTPRGKISLTRPPELKGKQAAILKGKELLYFARSDKDLPASQWENFFNSLKPLN